VQRIREVHAESRATYGVRRVHAALAHRGVRVGSKRIERLMRDEQLSGLVPKRFRRTTIRVPGVRVADDLVDRDFTPAGPNELWCADIKYVRSWQGWLYFAAVMDCYSRRIVGWWMRTSLEAKLVVDALEMAISRRRPGGGLIHHSGQGSQYVSLRFGERCRELGIHRSTGSKGDCFDNAVAESFFATLEKDLLRRTSFASRQDARTAVFDYIETFYNSVRLHSTLGYRSPIDYEKMRNEQKVA
jgi:putative transposase